MDQIKNKRIKRSFISKFTKKEINILFKKNNIFFVNDFFIVKKSSYSVELFRILISIPKNCGPAVHRNYIRRCLKDIFFKLKDKLNGYDYLIIFKKKKINLKYDFLYDCFNKVVL